MKVSKIALLLAWSWLLAAPAAALTCFGVADGQEDDWSRYKARFVGAEGRLIECFWAITRPDLYTYTFRFGDALPPNA